MRIRVYAETSVGDARDDFLDIEDGASLEEVNETALAHAIDMTGFGWAASIVGPDGTEHCPEDWFAREPKEEKP